MKFGDLKVTTLVLAIQGLLALYQGTKFPTVYLPFALFDFLLAWGVYVSNKTAIKVSLVYLTIDLFLAIFYLISGVLLKGIIVLLDFLAIHDMLSYIQDLYREEQSL